MAKGACVLHVHATYVCYRGKRREGGEASMPHQKRGGAADRLSQMTKNEFKDEKSITSSREMGKQRTCIPETGEGKGREGKEGEMWEPSRDGDDELAKEPKKLEVWEGVGVGVGMGVGVSGRRRPKAYKTCRYVKGVHFINE
jgi:hypothetical protein